MKVKNSNFLVLLAVLVAFAISARAQEEMPILEPQDPPHRDLNLGEDKTLVNDRGIHPQTAKDSLQTMPHATPGHPVKAVKPDANRNNSKETDEDALSFNFLYYMLQKFKMSDLVDQ